MTIGEKIKAARIAKGLTQDNLAEALNVSKSTISRAELDQRQFRLDQLYTLAEILDIPAYELVSLTPKKRKELMELSKTVSEVEDRYNHGEYVAEHDAWIPKTIAFLKELIDRELTAATAQSKSESLLEKGPEEPEFKKRRRRTAKFDGLFGQLNNAGQLNVLEHLRLVAQTPEFQLQPKEPDIFTVLGDDERVQLNGLLDRLEDAKYKRFQLLDFNDPLEGEKMMRSAEEASDLNMTIKEIKEQIGQIAIDAAKRANPIPRNRTKPE